MTSKRVKAIAGEDIKRGALLMTRGEGWSIPPIVFEIPQFPLERSGGWVFWGMAAQDAIRGEKFDVVISGTLNG